MMLRLHRHLRRDEGVAMLLVMGIALIMMILVAAMLTSVLNTQRNTRTHRNVTSAQAAAEAGIDDTVYRLGLDASGGGSNWNAYQTTKNTPGSITGTVGAGSYSGYVTTNGLTATQAGDGDLAIVMQGKYAGNTRTVRVVVHQTSPKAFDYSLFGAKGIDIHHHGGAWLSPQVVTTGVHSNGYINIDYSAEFTVNTMEAVGNITFQKGGGKTPGGSIPETGYNWTDPLPTPNLFFPGRCEVGTSGCDTTRMYSGNATVYGTVYAGSVTMGSRGNVLPVDSVTMGKQGLSADSSGKYPTETGQEVNPANGDIYAGSATLNGDKFTTPGTYTSANCGECGYSDSAAGGQIGGSLVIKSGYAPQTIPFPSIDYSSTYRVKANSYGPNHVFASATDFLNYITNPSSGLYYKVAPQSSSAPGTLVPWSGASNGPPDVILLNGFYDITGGSLSLDWGNLQKQVNAATSTSGPPPVIIVRGALVVEAGGITIKAGLVVVGEDNRDDFLYSANGGPPVQVDTAKLVDPNATSPGVLAAGGSIDTQDYDTDANWDSSATYEPNKVSSVYVRGLVYAGLWDPKTNTSVPENQHWHNYDPKNVIKIYGSQVGADLHDCNNFSFTYDPLVKKAYGFGGTGTISIVDYQELGS